ncbi:SDR family oxidoreductase [Roseococcus sp. SYP-B2431]|uniref:SDR family NAD(P)-dependent oxidoreductase n=1 Tax=Roseococcus sp. SYP-B2431 TaxID=2496640 RepID=UPI00103F669F|nr:SDR family NAD(P)-dependent oxidoreductase [Roseococcus sp. SYP-B2431]TCH98361.1 SDR family oxidoreductase [Roseococcus sp. SYP-B2431]
MSGDRLKDKVAIVTGSGDGLGEAIAERFAEEGAKLVLADIDPGKLAGVAARLRQLGREVVEVTGDMTDEAVANSLVETAIAQFGVVDVLVNNVGGNRPGLLWEMSVEEWDRILTLNLRPTFLCTRAVAPHMIKRRYGRIVCTSSGAREGAPWLAASGAAPYSTAKAGVHGFVRDMAFEFGEYGICINAVGAGAVNTKRLGPYFEKLEATSDCSPQRLTPLRRVAQPREIANAVLFLASDEASYITGTTLNVNGGR